MKKLIMMILCCAMIISVLVTGASAAGGLYNFQKSLKYADVFTDVPAGSWYYANVAGAYEYGLMYGSSGNKFSPELNIHLSEAIALAARLHSIYYNGKASFTEGSPWYDTYVQYAISNGIITKGQFADYEAYATRMQFAQIFANAMPAEALAVKNTVGDGAIPDVKADTAVYKLFRAGVMTGKTQTGLFYPNDKIMRCEAAAVVTRMADTTLRVSFIFSDQQSANGTVDLRNKVALARDAAATAIKSYKSAIEYFKAFLAAGDPLSKAIYGDAMTKELQFTMTSTQACANEARMAASLCQGNTKLDKVREAMNKTVLSCDEATKGIAAIIGAPTTADWSLVDKYLTVCGSAITDALNELG